MKDEFGYTPEQNKEIDNYLTRPSKSADVKKVEMALNLRKNTIDALNKYEDGPDLVEQAIRLSSTPVAGYVGGATPSDTEPTRAERIAGQKQLEKLAVQPDSRGYFKKLVAANEKEFKDKRDFKDKRGQRFINKTTTAVENPSDPRSVSFNPTTQLFTNEKRDIAFKGYNEADAWNKSIGSKTKYYPDEATPKQVGALAERMERSRQMTGGDGRYDKPKPIIKKKKPYKIEPVKINFLPMPTVPYEPIAPDPYALELERRVKENIRKTEEEKRLNNNSGLAGLIGGFKQ